MPTIPPDIIAAAKKSHAKWKIPASVTLAQWALESAWGASMPPGSNNPFGIKALAGQPSVVVPTREVIAGKSVTINAAFRKFASLDEAFDHHGELLATGKPYAKARACLPDAADFADALTGVYATDPAYGGKLREIMRRSNLYLFDEPELAKPAAPAPQPKPSWWAVGLEALVGLFRRRSA